MANEVVIIELGPNGGMPVRRTVADGTSISGMTILKLTDPNTAAASSGLTDVFGGIAVGDKVANDGSTSLGAYTEGVYDIKCGDAVTAGRFLAISGANILRAAVLGDFLSGCHVGIAEETATANEVIRVRLRGN